MANDPEFETTSEELTMLVAMMTRDHGHAPDLERLVAARQAVYAAGLVEETHDGVQVGTTGAYTYTENENEGEGTDGE